MGLKNPIGSDLTLVFGKRSYYEYVICDERDYESIVEYIWTNPQNWEKDEEYI